MDIQARMTDDSRTKYLKQNYKFEKTLGHGSFGVVERAEHVGTKLKVAIKILKLCKIKNGNMEEKVRMEIKVGKLFAHPHIIRIFEVIETSTRIYIVMEYANMGNLFEYITGRGRLHEDKARKMFQQIISGVEYCHRKMVVHRDLKPENLLLDSKGNIKIADFGLTNIMQDGHFLKTSCGSPSYAAPEVILHRHYAGPGVDVWSCGIILYALLCGTEPFDDANLPNLFKKIKAGVYTVPSHLSPGARDLLRKIIVVDPLMRISIPEIRQHYWFQTHLPRYLVTPWQDSMKSTKIDEDIVQRVMNLGIDRNLLVQSLQNRIQNNATVTYHLLLDDRSGASSSYLGSELPDSMESDSMLMQRNDPTHLTIGLHADRQNPRLRPQFRGRKWVLGHQSGAQPHEIMKEALKALQRLNIRWKKIGHYNIRCRMSRGFFARPQGIILQGALKFEVQLYRAQEEKYVLDLRRVTGSQAAFLDLCAAFLAQLRGL